MNLSPGWKLWLSLLVAVILGVIVSISSAVNIADKNTTQQLRSQCETLQLTIQVYKETPPQTQTGKNLQSAYVIQYAALGCPEPKGKQK